MITYFETLMNLDTNSLTSTKYALLIFILIFISCGTSEVSEEPIR